MSARLLYIHETNMSTIALDEHSQPIFVIGWFWPDHEKEDAASTAAP